MRVDVLGASGTFPGPGHPAAGFLVTHQSARVICDLGPGTFAALPIDPDLVDAVVISHGHPDHCSDLLAMVHARTYRPQPPDPIPVYAPQMVWDRISDFLGEEPGCFRFVPTNDGDQISVGPIAVSFSAMDHSVPTVGSRWEATGRTMFYTGDTGAAGSWRERARGVDVMICEASYQDATDDPGYPQHLTARRAGEIAREVEVGSLVLTHIPPYLDKRVSIAEAEESFGKAVQLAVPGAWFSV